MRFKAVVLLVTLTATAFVTALPLMAGDSKGTPAAREEFAKGEKARTTGDPVAAASAYRKAIELDSNYLEAHSAFMSSARLAAMESANGPERAALIAKAEAVIVGQYQTWSKQHPDKGVFHWALGRLERDRAKSEQHYLNAVKLDPSLAEAWYTLSLYADFQGNKPNGLKYIAKALEAKPDDPGYAFYYAHKLKEVDPARGRDLSLQVAARFPDNERGAQALYWLGNDSQNTAEKIVFFERLRRDFPADKFRWTRSAVGDLFNIYDQQDPAAALALAKEIQLLVPKPWAAIVEYQQALVDAHKLKAQGKYSEALALLDKTKARRDVRPNALHLLSAELLDKSGETAKAYDGLLKLQADGPTPAIGAAISSYGAKLGKTAPQVAAELWTLFDAKALPAKDFALEGYSANRKYALADFKGKVVLLNFWYPT